MMKILIADGHAIVRKGLVQILADSPDAILVDEASDGKEAWCFRNSPCRLRRHHW